MLQFGAVARRGSVYFLGTATGLALAIPLAAAFTANPITREAPIVPIATQAGTIMQSQYVNRSTKGSRLEVRLPSAPAENTSVVVKASGVNTLRTAASEESATGKSSSAAPVARAMPSLKGCLSSIGVTKSNLTTEELTVCVADASVINSIN